MTKSELGTKRVCPETGRKFYDLNRDPIVSPYTGISYPRSYFDSGAERVYASDEPEEEELDAVVEKAEFVPLDEVAVEEEAADEDLPDIDAEDVDLDDEEADTFLEDEEEEDGDDMTGILGGGRAGEDDEV